MAYGFVHIRTRDGWAVRLLTLIDEYTRERLAIRAQRSIRSTDVIDTMADLMMARAVARPHPLGQRDGIHRQDGQGVARGSGGQDLVHRAWVAVVERIRGELQRQVEGRTLEPGGLLCSAGGADADRAIPPNLQPDQAPQFPGLPATSTGNCIAHTTCSGVGRSNIESGTTIGGNSIAWIPPARMPSGCEGGPISCRHSSLGHRARDSASSAAFCSTSMATSLTLFELCLTPVAGLVLGPHHLPIVVILAML